MPRHRAAPHFTMEPMLRIPALILLVFGAALAQTPAATPKDPPPPEVDKALRERVQQFFDLQVQGQFRKAEQYVAEDLKDYYYNLGKPKYENAKLLGIEYSEHFTRATATIAVERYINAPPFPPDVLMKGNIQSTWRIEDGKWMWYEDPNAGVRTPFGMMQGGVRPPGAAPGAPGALPMPPGGMPGGIPGMGMPGTGIPGAASGGGIVIPETIDFVKADKTSVAVKPGQPGEVTLSNTAIGPMKVAVTAKPEGITAKPESFELSPNGKTTVTVTAGDAAKGGVIQFRIEPTSQTISVQVDVP